MSLVHGPHPTPDELAAFGHGRLADPAAAVVASHLALCAACAAQLDRLSGDQFLAALRDAAHRTTPAGTPATVAAAETTAEDPGLPEELLGSPRYRVVGLIGRGGMGDVYRAEESAIRREVAVKVLHPRYRGNVAAVERFLAEAGVTARLQHPGIPPVFQVGTLPDGSPFLAMKLIAGRTLAEILSDPDRPTPAAPLVAFEHVCQAVGYAHSRGVIHRDLKPANVMVGAFGEVQVMDWGLARMMRDEGGRMRDELDPEATPRSDSSFILHPSSLRTRDGAVMGTPAYMAPEQARGEVSRVDRRSDVFGLGAVLSEILTGEPPFSGPNVGAVLRMAISGTVSPAFARLDRCAADPELVALCKRCLAPDPGDRPADAGEVARAVAELRVAADERARRAELRRAKARAAAREQRKRRRVQVALAVALGLLVASGVGAAWWQDRVTQKQQAEEIRLEEEATRRTDQNADALGLSLQECEASLRAENGNPALAGAALADAERRVANPGGDRHADRLARCRRDLAALRGLIDLDQRLSTSQGSRRPEESDILSQLRGIFTRFGVDLGRTDTREAERLVNGSNVRERLIQGLDLWLVVEWGLTERTPAVRALLRAVDSDPFRDEMRDLVASGSRADKIAFALLAARPEADAQPARFCVVIAQCGAIPMEKRRQSLQSALARDPGDLWVLMALGESYPFDDPKSADNRIRYFQAAVAVAPWNGAAHHNLSVSLRQKGDLATAELHTRKAAGLSSANANTHSNIGVILQERGDLDGAVAAHKKALELKKDDGRVYSNYGITLDAKRDWAGAIAAYREAMRLDPTLLEARSGLGVALVQSGDVDGAIAVLRSLVADYPNYSPGHNNLGVALQTRGELPAAIASHREAIRVDPTNGKAYQALGNALALTNDTAGFVAALREAARLLPRDSEVRTSFGMALASTGDIRGAMAEFREAVALNPKDAFAITNLGNTLRATGDLPRALAAQEDAKKLQPDNAQIRMNLGNVLLDLGRTDAAMEVYHEAVRLDPKLAEPHFNISRVLYRKGDRRGAIAALRAAVAANPRHFLSRYTLGLELNQIGDVAGAQVALRAAVAIDPKHAEARFMLAFTLMATGELGAAVANLRDAIRLDDTRPGPHFLLGQALVQLDDLAGAEAAFREVIRLDPAGGVGHYGLGLVLHEKGDFAKAIQACEDAVRVEPQLTDARRSLAQFKRHRDLRARVEELAAGKAMPTTDPAEAAELAAVCQHPAIRRYALATRLYAVAGTGKVVPAGVSPDQGRYSAARAAILVATGKDVELTEFGMEEWGHFTGLAYRWLKSDLKELTARAGDPGGRATVRAVLTSWKKDRDLAAVRDPEWLAAMSPSDRKRWESLWAEVDALLRPVP